MRSPTIALLWEIWQRRRWTVAAIAGLTILGRLVHVLEAERPSALTTLLGLLAFVLLFALVNYTESARGRGIGQFPRRLFTLPVTSLRLAAVPVLAGIASIELLYLPWMAPLSRGGSTSAPFVAVLLAASVVFYLSALWMLERAGTLRLLVVGLIAFGLFALGQLPSFPPTPPPSWRSERVVASVVAGLAVLVFVLAWRHVDRLRAGGARRADPVESLIGWMADAVPTRRKAFANAAAAHFWFEWRSSGVVLPAVVAGVVLLVIMPVSWLVQSDAAYTIRLLLVAFALPVVLAVPVGIACCKPSFWSEDLGLPAFVAVRPLSSHDLVAIKVKVAALSTVLSWLVVVLFLTVWLSSWANVESLSQLAIQIWAFHGHSVQAVYGSGVLVVLTGMCLTWRCLVTRLWSGLSGIRLLFVGSLVSIVVLVIAAIVFDAGRLPGWLLGDPARLAPVVWIAAVAVIAKYWLAAYAWRGAPARYLLAYLLIWLAGTASLLALGIMVWGIVRVYVPLDADRLRSVVILLALLAVPLARVGIAPLLLTRNRHR